MNDAEQLIRACATKKLTRDVTYDVMKNAAAKNAEDEALAFLQGENAQRGGPARIRATTF
jgi:hypothetical protein